MSSSRTKLVSTRLTDAEYAAVERTADADTISALARAALVHAQLRRLSSRPSNGTAVTHPWNRTGTPPDPLPATTRNGGTGHLHPTITRQPPGTARLPTGRSPDGPGI